jgi:hypothetical protein
MTQVTFYRNESGDLTRFRIEGHSGYAEEGEDIVCAAISALAINTINSVNELTDTELALDMDADEAVIDASLVRETSGPQAQLLLKSLALGLTNLEADEAASEFIDVIFEEV